MDALPEDRDLVDLHDRETLWTAACDRFLTRARMALHLAPGGQFRFLERDSAVRKSGRHGHPRRRGRSRRYLDRIRRRHAAEWDGTRGIVNVDTPGLLEDCRRLSPGSRRGFPRFDALSGEIAALGLEVDRWQGAPAGEPLRPRCPDLIASGRPAI